MLTGAKEGVVVAAFFIAVIVFISSSTAFANEESDAHNVKGNEYFNNAKNEQDYQNAINEYTAAIKIDSNDNDISIYYSNRVGAYYTLGSDYYK